MAKPAFLAAMSRRNQLFVLYGVPAVIIIGLAYWGWRELAVLGIIDNELDPGNHLPAFLQRDDPESLWAQITSTQKDIDGYQQTINQEPAITKQLASLKADIEEKKDQLPRESEKSEMRDILERLAREIPKDFGMVKIMSVSISDSASNRSAANEARTVTYSVNLIGDQEGILKYIDSIERYRRFMVVNRIALHSGGLSVDEHEHMIVKLPHQVQLEIQTKIYVPKVKQPQ